MLRLMTCCSSWFLPLIQTTRLLELLDHLTANWTFTKVTKRLLWWSYVNVTEPKIHKPRHFAVMYRNTNLGNNPATPVFLARASIFKPYYLAVLLPRH